MASAYVKIGQLARYYLNVKILIEMVSRDKTLILYNNVERKRLFVNQNGPPLFIARFA